MGEYFHRGEVSGHRFIGCPSGAQDLCTPESDIARAQTSLIFFISIFNRICGTSSSDPKPFGAIFPQDNLLS